MGSRSRSRFERIVALVVLVALVPFSLNGCVAIKVKRQAIVTEDGANGAAVTEWARTAGAFRFRAVRKAKDLRQEQAQAAATVVAALYRVHDGGEQVVWRDHSGNWAVDRLPPGNYVVKVERVFDAGGQEQTARGDTENAFAIRPGEAAEANVVLEKTPWGLTVTVVLLIALLVILAKDADWNIQPHHIIFPPSLLLPPDLPLPGDVAIDLMLHFAYLPPPHSYYDPYYAERHGPRPEEPDPGPVRWYGPADGAVVESDAAIEVILRDAPDVTTVDQRTFGVFTRDQQLLAGISIGDDGRRLRLEPLYPLPPGERIVIRLLGEFIRTPAAGKQATVGENYRWHVRVAD